MQLNFKVNGEGFPLVILHGLMGSLDNWQSVARTLGGEFKVYIVDLRNHGRSPWNEHISYPLMAADLLEFFDQQSINKAHVLGHSMGGKVAMEFALIHPDRVEKLVIADIAPRVYGRHHDEVFDTLFSVDLASISSRGEAEDIMQRKMPDAGMRQFLLKSLDRTPEGNYEWKMNLQVLHDDYEAIVGNVTEGLTADNETLVIKGGNSNYIKPDDIELFRKYFPNSNLVTIENAGHWVHAEAPGEFLEALRKFLI